ncbi:MAG: HyaD/HybD family hydrogenase maturation endopeptidase [Nitrospiraceae bacterium]|nr:HyaD/HybD family hydrogenase maturation endopeptidase [Nitrospiraceae bacterium]
MNTLVLGIGNILMMDEGVGVRAVEELQRRFVFPEGVAILDGGTSGLELLAHIRDRDFLIIIDAVRSGHAPGAVVRIEGDDVPAIFKVRISPHQLGLSDLLAAAMLSGSLPGSLVLFGIEPKQVELGLGLSAEVQTGLERLLSVVLPEELKKVGIDMQPAAEALMSGRSFWDSL